VREALLGGWQVCSTSQKGVNVECVLRSVWNFSSRLRGGTANAVTGVEALGVWRLYYHARTPSSSSVAW
jgi:hypothetical protein